MASSSVLSNSLTKKDHIEAGKRRLEEFRKQRAESKAKKPLPANHATAENRTERPKSAISDSVLTDKKETGIPLNDMQAFVEDGPVTIVSSVNEQAPLKPSYSHSQITAIDQENSRAYSGLQPNADKGGGSGKNSVRSGSTVKDEQLIKGPDLVAPLSDAAFSLANSSPGSHDGLLTEKGHPSTIPNEDVHSSCRELFGRYDGMQDASSSSSLYMDHSGRSLNSSFSYNHDLRESEPATSSEFSSSLNTFSNQFPDHGTHFSFFSENTTRNFRPSFLDSLNLTSSSSAPKMFTEPERSNPPTSSNRVPISNLAVSSDSENVFPEALQSSSNYTGTFVYAKVDKVGQDAYKHSVVGGHDLPSLEKNNDFATLEQHIEDLTREKFSLQRALDASRTLSESLATENSTLTETYNQQGIVVSELKQETGKLQMEIHGNLVEIESLKAAYSDAQLECNAADDRAKLLASELIALEEKALKLRSSELKLERQLEESHADVTSCKKKIISLHKEGQDLHATLEALHEEKKVLQSKLSKSVLGWVSGKKDASVATDDLDIPPGAVRVGEFDPTRGIPPEQNRVIGSISALMSEVAAEKEGMMRALAATSSENSNLREQMRDLSRKLEGQTQRLELLMSQKQSMAVGLPSSSREEEKGTAYVDEGDEVVERVLGWIMRIFPGGPSRRQRRPVRL